MDKGTVVFIPCAFKRGGFPTERVFLIGARGDGRLSSLADVRYCFRHDGSPLGDEPPEGEEIEGRLLGVVVRMREDGSVRVHLPDGEVYDLDRTEVVPAREAASRHVPI
jgi:hypothetical protein